MTLSELARETLKHFTTDTRDDGTEYVKTTDDAPEWLPDLIHEAHAHMFPDDWRYEAIRDVLDALADLDFEATEDVRENDFEIVDGLIDIYTHDLTGWLHSRTDRVGYVDQAEEDYGAGGDTFQRLQQGQREEYREILGSVVESLAEELEEREEEPEAATA